MLTGVWTQHSGELNLPHFITADTSSLQWMWTIAYLQGYVRLSLPLCCNALACVANIFGAFGAKYYLQGSDWLKLHWWLAARNPLPTLHRQCRATHFPAVIWKLPATLLTSRLPWTWHASGTPDFMSSLCGQKQNKLTTKPICPPRPKCQSALWSQNAAARKALWIKHNGKNKLK